LCIDINIPYFTISGIVNSEGRLWRENRAFLCRMTFGAKNSGNTVYEMQNCIQRETIELLQQLRSKSDEAVNPDMLLNTTFSNVICSMVMSTRFRHDDEKFQEFMRLFDEGFKLFSDTGAMTFIPVLKYLPGTNKTLKKLRANHDKTLAFIREIVDAHKANLDPSNPKDLVDNYLIEMMDKGKDSPLFAGCADPQRQIEQVVADLFSAGVETVKTTTMWAMLYMVRNPEVMRKVQEELDSVVGCDRLPEWSDRRNLPYTHATINEIMRMSSIVATATTHSNTR
jgi:26-hydroxylase